MGAYSTISTARISKINPPPPNIYIKLLHFLLQPSERLLLYKYNDLIIFNNDKRFGLVNIGHRRLEWIYFAAVGSQNWHQPHYLLDFFPWPYCITSISIFHPESLTFVVNHLHDATTSREARTGKRCLHLESLMKFPMAYTKVTVKKHANWLDIKMYDNTSRVTSLFTPSKHVLYDKAYFT